MTREQLDRAKSASGGPSFLRLAGEIEGPSGLSARKGFSRK
jgi:hypothetical protein